MAPPTGTGELSEPARAVVTGGAGFLGRHTALVLSQAGWLVCGIGHGELSPQDCSVRGLKCWIRSDVTRIGLERASAAIGAPDLIVHAAGGASVRASWLDPETDFRRTVTSTAAVIAAARTLPKPPAVVLTSSAAVYGQQPADRLDESLTLRPISPYGLHKRLAEDICLAAQSTYGIPVRIVRFFSLYGRHLQKQLLWDLVRRLSAKPGEILLGGTGEEKRDYLAVRDAAQIILRVAAWPERGEPLVVNGGTGAATTTREMARAVARALDIAPDIRFSGEAPKGDPRTLVADCRRLAALGFSPTVDLEAGVRDYVDWARAQL